MILSDLKLFQTMIIIIIVKKKKKNSGNILDLMQNKNRALFEILCGFFFVIHKLSEPSTLLVQAQLQPEQSTQQPNHHHPKRLQYVNSGVNTGKSLVFCKPVSSSVKTMKTNIVIEYFLFSRHWARYFYVNYLI